MIKQASISSRVVVGLIRAYQYLLSPWLGPRCRYSPSCSNYALEAIRRHGSSRGGWLALKRVGRCHPWATPGHDPVPGGGYERPAKSVTE